MILSQLYSFVVKENKLFELLFIFAVHFAPIFWKFISLLGISRDFLLLLWKFDINIVYIVYMHSLFQKESSILYQQVVIYPVNSFLPHPTIYWDAIFLLKKYNLNKQYTFWTP